MDKRLQNDTQRYKIKNELQYYFLFDFFRLFMYQEFFSLKVKPFSISPDPNFLFLSERHREAIAHLQQGLQGYGGFALLTGEVGTGKTTICRSLLENMNDDTDISFILNPALSAIELLSTICDSFKIAYQQNSLRSLFDELSNWIVDNHHKKRHSIVLIDEAQHLSFDALEQLRLLTDIEINNQKVLQVILIGQTELQEKLKEDRFRQLAQRITARYHLLSLTQQESNFYIQHRLNIAGSNHAIFDKSALQEIYKNCHGTPRLTNILCDRSLLAAFTQDTHIVNIEMVKQASKEVYFSPTQTKKSFFSLHWRLATIAFLIIFTVLQAPKIYQYINEQEMFTADKQTESFVHVKDEVLEPQWFDEYPKLDLSNSKYNNALSDLYSVWGYQVDSRDADCQQGSAVLLTCYTQKMTLKQLKQLNYPSVVRLEENNGSALYAVIYKISEHYQLLINGNFINVSETWFKNYWTGDTTLLWKAPFPLTRTIKHGDQGERVTWLANQLNQQQGWPSENKIRFDLRLMEQVSSFQRKQGLMDDGIVGPLTLMQLATNNAPRLLQETN